VISIDTINVIVPAHNEADRIARCVRALDAAARHPTLLGIPVTVILILDACADDTGGMAEKAAMCRRPSTRLVVAEADYRNVGKSRAAGMAMAEHLVDGGDPTKVWLATTDADSTVPRHWLAHHLDLHARGYEAVAGTVRVRSWQEHAATTPPRYSAGYRARGADRYGHDHVHGASLGFTSAAYQAAGGFAPVSSSEDRLLWNRLQSAGVHTVTTPHATVTTSGRREGRAPDGFAAFLRAIRGTAAGPS
jgi:cellulose synthase/poly-beta-1,6-N-acetylglucosamine synthase-like glycosyltransferase